MKVFILLLLLPLFATAQESDHKQEVPWVQDYEVAMTEARNNGSNIILYFTGSDWCAPCKMLKTDLFATDDFRSISKNYVLLYIDIPRNKDLLSAHQSQHNHSVLSKYNKKGVFPLFVILDSKGKALDEYSGYSMTGDIQYHMALFDRYKS